MKNNDNNIRRVVITGMGWVTPLGHDINTVWKKLLAGESGIDRIRRFDADTFPTTFAGEVRDYDYKQFVSDPSKHEFTSLNTQYALGAAAQAWNQSGLNCYTDLDKRRVGIYLGAGEGPPDFYNAVNTNLTGWDAGDKKVDPDAWIAASKDNIDKMREICQEPGMPMMHLAMEFGVSGPAYNCLTACAASTQAIGEAMELIRRGDADVMIAGGTHTMIHPLGITGFNRLTALSTNNDNPPQASRPFDLTRDGFVMGEGSGMVILESLEHAQARRGDKGNSPGNFEIIAELIGFGSSADAYRITDMEPDGRGACAAMAGALHDAGLDPEELSPEEKPVVQYISAHGTSTKENDSCETRAVKSIFNEAAYKIPMTSIKSMMGHLIAAAGAVELIVSVLTIREGKIPPTMNHNTPDPECDLDCVPNKSRSADVEVALSNSFGFGGQNDTLIARRYRA